MAELPRTGPLPRPKSLEEAREVLRREVISAPDQSLVVKFRAYEFTSICPRTGQPDFGEVEIRYKPRSKCLESKSLKFYLWAYRDVGAFCETLSTMILQDVRAAIDPKWVQVTVRQNPRGGIELESCAEWSG